MYGRGTVGHVHPYLDVLAALNGAQVRYVVVGGVAVALRGYLRATVDLDVVIDLVPDNAERAIDALSALGLQPRLPVPARDFADEQIRREWVEHRNLMVFSMWHPNNPAVEVDIFAAPPIEPALLLADAELVALGDLRVPVASTAHLIQMKRLAGRPQDLVDVEKLERSDE